MDGGVLVCDRSGIGDWGSDRDGDSWNGRDSGRDERLNYVFCGVGSSGIYGLANGMIG